jgi:putative phosphoribosyl transferase
MRVPAGGHQLLGDYGRPSGDRPPRGLVLFAHGSGSSRHSPRNQFVARTLEQHGLATLLIDLLTPEEEQTDLITAHLRFDIPLLAGRLGAIIGWLKHQPETALLPIGLFGASTGAGAALIAAAVHPDQVAAVVSRGGRPDLAGDALSDVTAPTLLIVGGHDDQVVEMNREAMARMRHTVELEIVPGATHLFEEPDALERVARLAARWFLKFLRPAAEAVDGTKARVS